ncbi:hypothetical protein IJ00_17125 [Calothrix sp. 336/3]|nr:hypothetical protein IJ00_17125 [Calothrix sp. 336/3]
MTFLALTLTIPTMLICQSLSNSKVAAQSAPQCPSGSTLATLDWDQQNNFQTANFNQSINIGSVSTNFRMQENPAGIIRDENPENSPGNVGRIPYGRANPPFGGINQRYLRWGIDARGSRRGGNATLTITFAQPITLPTPLLFLDVDRDRQGEPPFQDQITVTASNQGQNVPVTLTNMGVSAVNEIVNGNIARGVDPRVPPGNAPIESSMGDVFATITGEVTQIQIVYQSGPLYREGQSQFTEPGQDETIGLADFNICIKNATGSIGDFVFNDKNGNGVQDANDTGISGVKLILRNSQGQIVATTTTNSNGIYAFPNLPLGNYTVEVEKPGDDFTATTQTILNANLTTTNSDRTDIDFGFRLGSLGSGQPRIRLVKRITNVLRNGQTVAGIDFNNFIDDLTDDDDNILQQNQGTLPGQVNIQPKLKSGDRVEYTIYFLTEGQQGLQNVRFCDLVPQGTSYINNTITISGTTNRSKFFSPLAPLEDFTNICGSDNLNGAVVQGPTNIPGGQFGFIRFLVNID